jgi:hypothetical protein
MIDIWCRYKNAVGGHCTARAWSKSPPPGRPGLGTSPMMNCGINDVDSLHNVTREFIVANIIFITLSLLQLLRLNKPPLIRLIKVCRPNVPFY